MKKLEINSTFSLGVKDTEGPQWNFHIFYLILFVIADTLIQICSCEILLQTLPRLTLTVCTAQAPRSSLRMNMVWSGVRELSKYCSRQEAITQARPSPPMQLKGKAWQAIEALRRQLNKPNTNFKVTYMKKFSNFWFIFYLVHYILHNDFCSILPYFEHQ